MRLIPYAGKEPNSRGPRGDEASGYYERSPKPKISVRFPQDRFDKIVALAAKRGCSFSKAVNELVERALEQSMRHQGE